MIRIVGTSHISTESVDSIENIVEDIKPDLIAVELDENRLMAMLSGNRGRGGGLIITLISLLQQYLGAKTGIMPGQEMLTAFKISQEKAISISLIDQRIEITVRKINQIPLKEKLKLVLSLFTVFLPSKNKLKIDLRKVPEEEFIEEIMGQFGKIFPRLHRVLVAERNEIMARNLIFLNQDYGRILVFVGAGHVRGLKKILEDHGVEVNV